MKTIAKNLTFHDAAAACLKDQMLGFRKDGEKATVFFIDKQWRDKGWLARADSGIVAWISSITPRMAADDDWTVVALSGPCWRTIESRYKSPRKITREYDHDRMIRRSMELLGMRR